jgi:hypothetical protein
MQGEGRTVTKLRFYAVLLLAAFGTLILVAASGPYGVSDGGGF